MRKLFSFLILLSTYQVWVEAQTATVYGTVRDEVGDPINKVTVRVPSSGETEYSNSQGEYSVTIPSGKEVIIAFTHVSYESYSDTILLSEGQRFPLYVVMTIKAVEIQGPTVEDQHRTEVSTISIIPKKFELQPATSDLGFLKIFTGSNNELSSQYSVRGGNYDENLIYVNDFEIFRPFLVRSSQQEGLSFVNSDMIDNLTFSEGGFQAKYGDKMSSVLDITYEEPKHFEGVVSGSLLGGSATLGTCSKNHRFTIIGSARYKTSQYLLNSLETTGDYRPTFTDLQAYSTYDINDKLTLEAIGNYSYNVFKFIPQDRSTTFGVINNVLRLDVYFDGQEVDSYESGMGGLALNIHPTQHFGLKLLASVYQDKEDETYNITGEYFLSQVDNNLGSQTAGQTLYALGTGTNQDWARDFLDATVFKLSLKGHFIYDNEHLFEWGIDGSEELITDHISEWNRVDSAGYTLPYSDSEVNIQNLIRTEYSLHSMRYSGYVQDSWNLDPNKLFTLNLGTRFSYWDYNQQFLVSPRMQFSYQPNWNRDVVFKAAIGAYDQPPFYRELRDLYGILHTDVLAQRSIHFVAGTDYNFELYGRPFKFVTEAYYKYLYDLNPYEIDNVRIRYFGANDAKGYAAGIDFRLNGEFVKDAESWISLSFLQTKENLSDDVVYSFDTTFNGDGTIAHLDSVANYPGYIPRPTDQRMNLGIFFQDYIPGNENIKVHLNLLFGTGLPTGPPDHIRARDTLRLAPYRRVDIGFSYLLVDGTKEKNQNRWLWGKFNSIWASLEVFNLLEVPNVISYTWVKDISNTTYAVPNYLTSRRINLKLQARF